MIRAASRPASVRPVISGAMLRIRPTPTTAPGPVDERPAEVRLHRQERADPDVDQADQRQAQARASSQPGGHMRAAAAGGIARVAAIAWTDAATRVASPARGRSPRRRPRRPIQARGASSAGDIDRDGRAWRRPSVTGCASRSESIGVQGRDSLRVVAGPGQGGFATLPPGFAIAGRRVLVRRGRPRGDTRNPARSDAPILKGRQPATTGSGHQPCDDARGTPPPRGGPRSSREASCGPGRRWVMLRKFFGPIPQPVTQTRSPHRPSLASVQNQNVCRAWRSALNGTAERPRLAFHANPPEQENAEHEAGSWSDLPGRRGAP